MAQALFIQSDDVVEFTAAANLEAGDVVQLADGRAGLVAGLAGFKPGERAAATIAGKIEIQKVEPTTIFAAGAVVAWDNTNKRAVAASAPTASFAVGRAVKATTVGGSPVLVALNDTRAANVAKIATTGGTGNDQAARDKIDAVIDALRQAGLMA
jgi:predicted RecA/RadA family phage recombinase